MLDSKLDKKSWQCYEPPPLNFNWLQGVREIDPVTISIHEKEGKKAYSDRTQSGPVLMNNIVVALSHKRERYMTYE